MKTTVHSVRKIAGLVSSLTACLNGSNSDPPAAARTKSLSMARTTGLPPRACGTAGYHLQKTVVPCLLPFQPPFKHFNSRLHSFKLTFKSANLLVEPERAVVGVGPFAAVARCLKASPRIHRLVLRCAGLDCDAPA